MKKGFGAARALSARIARVASRTRRLSAARAHANHKSIPSAWRASLKTLRLGRSFQPSHRSVNSVSVRHRLSRDAGCVPV
jgi:hypothetical protein